MTQEFKGTKGKWERITANWDLDQCVFVEDTEQEICAVKSEAHNQIYDAQLIAHAPEMLEMLKYIVSKKTLHHEDLTNISELITKATTI